jgi:RNA polymerase sigma-70 factor (ECF subfamily)
MQDTYIDAYRNLSQFEQRADFKTWIFQIMLNNCYRKKQKSSFKNEVNTDSLTENAKPMFSNAIPDAKKISTITNWGM